MQAAIQPRTCLLIGVSNPRRAALRPPAAIWKMNMKKILLPALAPVIGLGVGAVLAGQAYPNKERVREALSRLASTGRTMLPRKPVAV